MDIAKILNTNRAILDMQAMDKAEAIEELTNLLRKDNAIDCREIFTKDVWQREAGGSTDFENHIMIPYGKPSVAINTTLATDHTHQDIPWETLDGSSVHCIVLFAVRLEGQNTTHIHLPSRVAGVLTDGDIIEQLLVETSPQRTIDLFSQYAQSNVF